MMRLQPSRSRVLLVAVPAVILGAVLLATTFRPGPTALVPTSSPIGSSAVATDAPGGPSPTPFATRFPPYVPTPTPAPRCTVPPTLPEIAAPVAAPLVVVDGVSMLFASHLYERRAGGELVVRDDPNVNISWGMGLWFAPAGGSEPRLVAAPEGGMVLPLALSPDGTVAAIWWLSSRRTLDQDACDGGIYLVSLVTGESQLVVRRDWTRYEDVDPDSADNVGVDWTDPVRGAAATRTYELPEAGISSDGQVLALIDDEEITIYAAGEQRPRYRHAGVCEDWTWSPVGAIFVAGCEDMTSAWIVDELQGDNPQNLALPWLAIESRKSGWGSTWASDIGFTRDGRIRLAGFFGYATGCEDPDRPCNIPPPAHAFITTDPYAGAASIRSGELDFLAGDVIELAATASWVYVERSDGGARTIRAATGEVSTARRLRAIVGASADGSLLFGSRLEAETGQAVVSSLDADGITRQVATIAWADGVAGTTSVIAEFGLVVWAPGS